MQEFALQLLAKYLRPDIILVLLGLLLVYKQTKCLDSKMNRLEDATRASLLSHISRIHAGVMPTGKISKDVLRIVEECHAQYRALGGDGYAQNMMEEIRRLPLQ